MSVTFDLRAGVSFAYDSELCTVVEVSGNAIIVRDSRGRTRRLRLIDVLLPVSDGGKARIPGASATAAEGAGIGVVWVDATDSVKALAQERADHVREVLTGYRSGTRLVARTGEPKPEYEQAEPLSRRQAAKARELGITERTLRRWVAKYQDAGEAGLVDRRASAWGSTLANIDPRWIATAQSILDEQRDEPRVLKRIVIERIAARLAQTYRDTDVKLPAKTTAYEALGELSRGRNTFSGSTKSKRSIANRPPAPYGHLSATRPGEYVLLDTTPLNVFALSPVTGKWVAADLTVAIDLYSRCVLGLRLTPGSTKSIDVSGVLLEAFQPLELPKDWGSRAAWPYHGLPDSVLVNPEKTRVGRFARAGIVPETIVVDHGKPYLSEHVTSACARLGISIQPARIYQPTDKSPVERFFRSLDILLQQLPGYKGADIAGRGDNPEDEAVYTIPQLEQIIREWVACYYHQRPHASLADPGLPGLKLSPAQKYEQGLAVAGTLRLPTDRNVLLELLPVVMRRFNHYGVEINGLRYNGPIVSKYQNRSRSLTRDKGEKWPFYINPADACRIHFFDPEDRTWHVLESELSSIADGPFSLDALEYAKKIAISQELPVSVDEVLAQLLEAWGAGQALTPEERRISARQAAQMAGADPHPDPDGLWSLRTVQARLEAALASPPGLVEEITGPIPDPQHETPQPEGGDDDEEDDLDEPGIGTDYDYEPMELM